MAEIEEECEGKIIKSENFSKKNLVNLSVITYNKYYG